MTGKLRYAPRPALEGAGIGTWIGAAVLVAGLHAGAIGFVMLQPDEEAFVDTAGVVTLELAPITTSVREDVPDAAPGKLMQEAPNTPEQTEKKEEVKPDGVELEKAPLAPEPEVALQEAKPQPDKPEEKPPEQKQELEKSQASVGDPTTSAPQKIDAPVSTTTAAPIAGNERAIRMAQATWQTALLARIETRKRYPIEARTRGEQGTTKVQFSIDRQGNVVSASVLESSGHSILDEEALAVLQRSSPLPPPPAHMPGETVALTLPLSFTIKHSR
ncbi:MAG: energy transducer TonB [Hyphomicrobiales bacterium]|nr:MAG: energy transducer TonB [Hyphomicrobiales bacterium]